MEKWLNIGKNIINHNYSYDFQIVFEEDGRLLVYLHDYMGEINPYKLDFGIISSIEVIDESICYPPFMNKVGIDSDKIFQGHLFEIFGRVDSRDKSNHCYFFRGDVYMEIWTPTAVTIEVISKITLD